MDDRTIIVCGLPGMGKTTLLSKIATDSLNGKAFLDLPPHDKVYSTVAIPGCYELDPSMIGKFDFSNSLLLIDEVSQFFDARDWKTFPKHIRTFFQIARHEHTSIVCCSQSWIDTDIRIRNLCYSIYLLKAIPFFDLSAVIPIRQKQDVIHGKLTEFQKKAGVLEWIFFSRKKYYSLFDSFCAYQQYEENTSEKYPGINYLVKCKKFKLIKKKKRSA